MNFKLFSEFHVTRQLSKFAAAALILATLLLVFAPSGSSQPAPRPPAWSVQSTDPAHGLLTLKGSVMVGIDSGMFWVVQFRIEGSGGGQLASFQPNLAVVLESPGSKPLAAPAVETTIGGKAQPQPGVVAKSPTASTVFTGIPTSGQTLMIQATGISPVEGVVASVTGPQTYTVGPPGPPCCAVTAINLQTATVTAKVNSNAQIFTFLAQGFAPVQPHEGPPPKPVPLVDTLTVGQPVWANLTTGQVSLNGKTPCCQITSEGIPAAGGGGKPPAFGVKNPIVTSPACCEITGLNQKAKTAGAKVKSNGQGFQIAVANPALFQSLRVGEAIWANFKTGRVSLNGVGPVDGMQIVGGGPMIAHLPRVGLKKPPYTAIPSPSSPPLTIHDHTLIMQAVLQNRNYLIQKISAHNWQRATPNQNAMGAMLFLIQSQSVPETTKERIRVALQTLRRAQWNKPSAADLAFRSDTITTLRSTRDVSSILGAVDTLKQKYAAKPEYVTALRLAKNLVNDGASTIYSPAWVATNLQKSTGGGVKPYADVLGCADSNDISPDCIAGGGGSPYPCPDPSNPACNSCPDPTNPSCQVDCTADPNNPACGPTPTCPDPTEIYPNCTTCPDPTQTYPNCYAPPPPPTPFPTPLETPPPPPTPLPPTCPDGTTPPCSATTQCPDPNNPACSAGPGVFVEPDLEGCVEGAIPGAIITSEVGGFEGAALGCGGGALALSTWAVIKWTWELVQHKYGNGTTRNESMPVRPGSGGGEPKTPALQAPKACCSITGINLQSATVSARQGIDVVFAFSVPNRSLLQSLRVGQLVWANFTTKQVSLDGQTACCEILPNEASRLMNPSVVTAGGFWVPLGRVAAVSEDQLSIRTVVRSVQRGARAPPNVTYSEDGATVTLTVKLADQARPGGLPSRVITATPGSSRVEVPGQNGQIRSMPGVLLEPPLPPLIGQMVWVNRTSRQIQWLNFPFSKRQEDDLGDSEHFRTHITVSLPGSGSAQGSVKGETDVWTFKEFGGFTGALRVTFVDDGGNALYSFTKGGNDDWHVCGHSDFICGASGITRDWEAAVLPDVLLQTASVKIQHSASGDTAWSDVFNDLLRICDAGGGCSTSSCNQSVPSTPSPHTGDPCTN